MSETKFNSYKTKSSNINTLDRELSIIQHPQNSNVNINNFMENFDNMSIQSNRFILSDKINSKQKQVKYVDSIPLENNSNSTINVKKQIKNIPKSSTSFNPIISLRPNTSIESNTRYIPYISPRPLVSKRLSSRVLSSRDLSLLDHLSLSSQIKQKQSKHQT